MIFLMPWPHSLSVKRRLTSTSIRNIAFDFSGGDVMVMMILFRTAENAMCGTGFWQILTNYVLRRGHCTGPLQAPINKEFLVYEVCYLCFSCFQLYWYRETVLSGVGPSENVKK